MADMPAPTPAGDRPLSPHVQIYRWPLTMLTSILHRVTGGALAAGIIVIALWLVATAYGRDTFRLAHEMLTAWYGRFILFGFTVALLYHLLNGIRHLCWDAGWGFQLKTARNTGLLVFAGTIILTIVVWFAGYWIAGALP